MDDLQKLSRSDALMFKQKVIDTWNSSNVWALKYGDEILGALTAFGSIYVTHVFRKELKIRPFATMTSFMPVVGLSTIAIAVYQSSIVTRNILNDQKCPLCESTRAAIGQVFFGMGYPLIGAPIICFYLADRLLTYPVPPLVRAPKEVFHIYKNIVMRHQRPFLFLSAIHMVAAYYVTLKKFENFNSMNLKRS